LFYSSSEKDIRKGNTSDIYFKRTAKILKSLGNNPEVVMEVFLKAFPKDYQWGVYSGISECISLLEGLKGLDIFSLPEGKVFDRGQPLMVLRGKYLDFSLYETSILGFLCHASGIATKAARIKRCAGKRSVYNFGARRAHPSITPMIERSAFIGGLDGVSTPAGARLIGMDPVGTMPHALILILGDTLQALKAFDKVIEKDVPRIALIDTLNDEKFEAIRIAEGFEKGLYGIRLDTPGSRRGNIREIIEEVRWELKIRGHQDIRIMLSGGLDEKDIFSLTDIVDAFGVGTSISNARVLDFSMDIVEIEGKKISKRGKSSGAKKVIRCKKCASESTILFRQDTGSVKCPDCGGDCEDLFIQMISGGRLIYKEPDPKKIRDRVKEELAIKDKNI